eukprot:TRINITY_DN2110_c0_g1_i1.p1 TRINITY_DN2110_c0_g1~~TRINITY_DN2110_c0_g1_i1.p1  ORF type:complete len:213 (-),score=45.42 TRINITY_DN2110_c0_g1_i1:193-831(-)
MSTAIKYFAIIRVIDHLPLYTYGFDPAIADECKKSALDLSRRLTPAELQNDVRRGEKHTYGKWCSTVDKHRIIYAMLVDSSYRDRHAYWAIKEFQQILFKNPEYHLMSDADAGKLLHAEGEKILQKYNDPNNWDKLTEPKEEMAVMIIDNSAKFSKEGDGSKGNSCMKNTLLCLLILIFVGGGGAAMWLLFFRDRQNQFIYIRRATRRYILK